MMRHAPQPAATSVAAATRRIVISLRLPPEELTPNARPCRAAKATATRRYRDVAYLYALAARPGRPMERARVTARFFFRDRRQRDKDNLLASLKAAFDGIADARVITNDAGMVHQPIEIFVDCDRPRVEIELEEVKQP
jgi:Holliday junction resolvase RusA-like endonuclease